MTIDRKIAIGRYTKNSLKKLDLFRVTVFLNVGAFKKFVKWKHLLLIWPLHEKHSSLDLEKKTVPPSERESYKNEANFHYSIFIQPIFFAFPCKTWFCSKSNSLEWYTVNLPPRTTELFRCFFWGQGQSLGEPTHILLWTFFLMKLPLE